MQQKVHMETAPQGLLRLAPLRDDGRFRELPIQEGSNLPPQGDGGLTLRIILHQAHGHVHPEAITAHGQPETHDIHHSGQGGSGAFVLGGLLPGPGALIVAIVQGGLAGEEVQGAGAVPLGDASQTAQALRRFPN